MPLNLNGIIINISVFILFFLISIFFIFKIKLESKSYKLMFIAYIFFWLSIMLVREYRGKLQTLFDVNYLWIVLASYGFIGIFFRPFSDFFTLRIKSRKTIIYFSLGFMFITYLILILAPSTWTNVLSTIGIGVGASMIGIYELMFKEQYSKNKSYLTVSILAIPPLLADFISSPIQALVSLNSIDFSFSNPTNNNLENFQQINQYLLLWLISIFFLLITFIMIFFIKEDRKKIGVIDNKELILSKKTNNSIWFFISICLVGSIISFVKFSNSGSIAIITIEKINNGKYPQDIISNLAAYSSLIFSVFQLLGSMSIYLFIRKKSRLLTPFLIGSIIWLFFHLINAFYHNPYFYFASSALNGLSYGILYNLVLGFVLSISFKKNKIKPMGVYQSVLSIGITASSFFVSFIKNNFIGPQLIYDYWTHLTINMILFSFILLANVIIIFLVKKNDKSISNSKYNNIYLIR